MTTPTGPGGDARPRVLLVTADASLRASFEGDLGMRGFDVACAEDGPGALVAFDAAPPDAVLLDYRIASSNGDGELCPALQRMAGESFLPVIYVTTAADLETKLAALRSGNDVCERSMDGAELEARIRSLLRIRAREQSLLGETDRARAMARVDALTGLGNRRAYDADLTRAWARAERAREPLALVLADIDWFKAVNDRHGHATGDEVLRRVGETLRSTHRRGDEAFRIGGEEFAVIAPATRCQGGLILAERMRRAIAVQRYPGADGPFGVTISFGVAAMIGGEGGARTDVVAAADLALYDAKATGRNRVACAGATP